MAQSHFAPQTIYCCGQGDGQAYWALNPRGRAIVFVHGFCGSATGTWLQFPSLLQTQPKCVGDDLIFYQYDSTRTPAAVSGASFRVFLDKLISSPTPEANKALPDSLKRPADFEYRELVLVAHSLGAVVTRLAMVDAHRGKLPWLKKARMVLYAPAHNGARVQELLMSAVTLVKWLGPIKGLAVYGYPTLEDLKAESAILKQLATDTEILEKAIHGDRLVATRVLHAQRERVVYTHRFCNDPPHDPIEASDHMSMCKPDGTRQRPLEILLSVLT